jgi:hypothetical protein
MAVLSNDIYVVKNEGHLPSISWKRGGDLVSTHAVAQISIEQIPEGYCHQPFKFSNEWGIELPKGYSALYTHPLNRTDLPFYTLSGVVDNDKYVQPVNFPFLIREDFEGLIEAGTPIAQIIPVKRESWSHQIIKFDLEFIKKFEAKFRTKIYRAYKIGYWSRKDYK